MLSISTAMYALPSSYPIGLFVHWNPSPLTNAAPTKRMNLSNISRLAGANRYGKRSWV